MHNAHRAGAEADPGGEEGTMGEARIGLGIGRSIGSESPMAHMSTPKLYEVEPMSSSGALYHRVAT